MVISDLKQDQQALGLFVEKYLEKQEAFTYLLKNFPLPISTPEGNLHKPKTKCIFRSYLIELLNAKVSEINVISNLIVV